MININYNFYFYFLNKINLVYGRLFLNKNLFLTNFLSKKIKNLNKFIYDIR
jgi:hypothetical protein